MKAIKYFFLIILLISVTGCHRYPETRINNPSKALIPVYINYPIFRDDMNFEELEIAIKRNLEYLYKLPPKKKFIYGPDTVTCQQIIEGQKMLLDVIKQVPDIDKLNKIMMEKLRYTGQQEEKERGMSFLQAIMNLYLMQALNLIIYINILFIRNQRI